MISSFNAGTSDTLSLRFLPTEEIPIEETVKRSPTEYPVPPFATVAATATPLLIVIFAVAFLPVPSTLTKSISLNVKLSADGV